MKIVKNLTNYEYVKCILGSYEKVSLIYISVYRLEGY